jgi:hypothetical protein
MEQSLLDGRKVPQPAKKFPAFYEKRRFLTMFTGEGLPRLRYSTGKKKKKTSGLPMRIEPARGQDGR